VKKIILNKSLTLYYQNTLVDVFEVK
jgi:hypothetical protein